MCRFDSRGWLVRIRFGRKPQVYPKPGVVETRFWKFPGGVSAEGQSLSEVFELALIEAMRAEQWEGT